MLLSKSKIFFFLVLSFLLGVFGASFSYPFKLSHTEILLALVLAVIFLAIFWNSRKGKVIGFCLLIFLSGVWHFNTRVGNLEDHSEGRRFEGTIRITREPEIKNGRKQIIAETEEGWRFLFFSGAYDDYAYGDKIQIGCDLTFPENREGSRFDYRMYLAKDEIYYICWKPKLEILERNEKHSLYSWMISVKEELSRKISERVAYPESGLLEGLLLGGDAGLPQSVQEDFSRTGMSHITAVSGYNVTIIAQYLMLLGILLGLWRKQAFWLAILGIFLFIFLIGFPASAVRAGIMGSLILVAMRNGRLASSENAIILSAGIMLLVNPLLLRYDVGFQLSFLATLGIVFTYPFLNEYLVKRQKHLSAPLEILCLTLSAQIFVLPVIFYNFESLSIVSPLANLLILPIIPFTMLLGFLMILASFVFLPLAMLFSWIVYLPLRFETSIISFLAGFKFSSVGVNFPGWGVWVWYLVLAASIFIIRKSKKLRTDE